MPHSLFSLIFSNPRPHPAPPPTAVFYQHSLNPYLLKYSHSFFLWKTAGCSPRKKFFILLLFLLLHFPACSMNFHKTGRKWKEIPCLGWGGPGEPGAGFRVLVNGRILIYDSETGQRVSMSRSYKLSLQLCKNGWNIENQKNFMWVETGGDKKRVNKEERKTTEGPSSSRRLPGLLYHVPVLRLLLPSSHRFTASPFPGKTLVFPPVSSLQMVQDKLHISWCWI